MRNLNHLSLTALDMFRHAAREGSILAAASKLNRVQSNVSTRIRQLEEQLGTVLFHRGPRGLVLSDDGRLLLEYADQLIMLSNEAVEALGTQGPMGELRIGAMESTAASRLPPILSDYHARFPNVHIDLVTDTAGGLVRRLNANDIDVAFVAEPLSLDGVLTKPVFEEELVLITPASRPKLRHHLSGGTVVAFEQGCAYRRYLHEWLLEEGIQFESVLSVGSYLAMLACVSAGTGYAVVPKSVLESISSGGRFHCHRLPKQYRRIKTLLAWKRGLKSVKLDALRSCLAS